MKIIWLMMVVALAISCYNRQQTTSPPPPATENTPAATEQDIPAPSPAQEKTFEQHFTDGAVHFDINPTGEGSYLVKIFSESAKQPFSREFKLEGKVLETHLLDLDGDSFSELYLILGGETHPEIKGYTSYQDRSAGEIVVKDKMPTAATTSEIVVRDGKMYRQFDNTNWAYLLTKGETSFILAPAN